MAVKVSYSDLEEAFFCASEDRHYWLDKKTAHVVSYGSEAMDAVQDGDTSDLPKWMESDVAAARAVAEAFGEIPLDDELDETDSRGEDSREFGRYERIEKIPSNEAFRFMEDFTERVRRPHICKALIGALRGSRPFRRFKDALGNYPKELEEWFEYEGARRREYICDWAEDLGVEIDFSNPVDTDQG